MDDTGIMTRLAAAAIRSIDDEGDEKVVMHKRASLNAGKLQAQIDLAATLPGITVPATKLNPDPFRVAAPNAVIDLRNGRSLIPTPTDRITQAVTPEHDPTATCPLFQRFLTEILPDKDVRDFLQRALGYSLTGSVREEVIFLLVGRGANGKSTLVSTIRRIMGDYATTVSTSLLTGNYQSSHETSTLALQGVRFAAASETDFGSHLAEAKIKSLVSSEAITARGAYQKSAVTFDPSHKLWLSTNYLPNIDGSDEGLARRLIVIDFPRTFSREERDPNLQESLLLEGSGILNWLIEGAILWQTHGLNPPQVLQDQADEYRDSMDTFGRFLEEAIEYGEEFRASNAEVWEAFSRFQQSEPPPSRLGRKSFSQAMLRRHRQENRNGVRTWPHLRVRPIDLSEIMRNL